MKKYSLDVRMAVFVTFRKANAIVPELDLAAPLAILDWRHLHQLQHQQQLQQVKLIVFYLCVFVCVFVGKSKESKNLILILFRIGIEMTRVSAEAICEVRCIEQCGARPVQNCACDPNTNELTVDVKISISRLKIFHLITFSFFNNTVVCK